MADTTHWMTTACLLGSKQLCCPCGLLKCNQGGRELGRGELFCAFHYCTENAAGSSGFFLIAWHQKGHMAQRTSYLWHSIPSLVRRKNLHKLLPFFNEPSWWPSRPATPPCQTQPRCSRNHHLNPKLTPRSHGQPGQKINQWSSVMGSLTGPTVETERQLFVCFKGNTSWHTFSEDSELCAWSHVVGANLAPSPHDPPKQPLSEWQPLAG